VHLLIPILEVEAVEHDPIELRPLDTRAARSPIRSGWSLLQAEQGPGTKILAGTDRRPTDERVLGQDRSPGADLTRQEDGVLGPVEPAKAFANGPGLTHASLVARPSGRIGRDETRQPQRRALLPEADHVKLPIDLASKDLH
jgi:hypothetical protein